MVKNLKNIQLKISLWGHAYNDAYIFIIPLLLPFLRMEFSLDYFQSGLILTLHVALRSIFSLIFGFLGDHFNHKHLFISFGFALSSIFLGSLIWISNIPLIVSILLLMAIGISTFHPLSTAMIGEKAKPEKRGRDLSLFNAAGTFGVSIMSLLFGWIVQMLGWRIACLIISLPGYLLAWGYTKLKNELPAANVRMENLTNQILFIIYFISRGLRGIGTWAILSFLPIYATDYIGLSPGVSAWLVSLYFIGELSGSLLLSKMLDRKDPLRIAIFITILAAFLTFIFTYTTILILIGIIVTGIGLTQGFYYPSQHVWITNVSSNQARGKIFGLVFFVEGLSSTSAPFIYGWLAEKFGLVYSYRLAVIPIIISLFLFIIVYHLAEKNKAIEKIVLSNKIERNNAV